jgi:amino acid adenylation domain-containing protein
VRSSLLKLGEEEHVLLVTLHHIVSDGWSMSVIVRELGALYAAYARGEESPLPELPIQYADYAAWERERLTGEVLDTQLSYWKQRLAGAPPVLELPADRPRPARQSYRGARMPFALDAGLTKRLKALAQEEGCTLFVALLAGYSALLSRYSGQEEIVVGSPFANRTRPETEGLIGFFVNTLALRTDLSGDPTFRELLARARETAMGAYEHQEVPFERLVEELAPERSLSHHPLFQAALSLQNAPREAAELPGLKMRPWESEGGTTKFDLLLTAGEAADGGLSGSWEYSTDLFDAATVERMHRGLLRLLAEAAADPARAVADIDLLTEEERRLCLSEWNQTETQYTHQHFIDLFEEQVRLRPDAVAVECGESLTYPELDRRANRLARRLRGLGVGRGALVGVLLERSAEAVVSVLGVLKSGAGYVPLDPSHPAARLGAILDDTAAPVVLTSERLTDLVPEAEGRRVLCVDSAEERERLSLEDDAPLARAADPGDLAYVIYTSGSTGTPKGVQIEHRSLANYLSWARSFYADGRPLSFALLSSLAYDLSATALYVPLVTGGRVVAFAGEARDGALDEALAHPRVEALKLTPSHLRLLAESVRLDSAARVLVVGGEALETALAGRVHELFGGRADIYNEYGPTEATVGCSARRYSPEGAGDAGARAEVSAGKPVANAGLYVLDARMRPVPVGVAGELYIGGDALARGYLKRPAMTAEKFVPSPFGDGGRLYRTGDVARWLADGELEFIGRRDGQVKVRGVRIEREEVRAAVSSHPGVRDCLVVTRPNARGEAALVCYYVARRELDAAELRAHAAARVVAEAVPEGWVHLRRMPLTLNGKVDEAGLPVWGGAGGAGARGVYVAPRTAVEERLCEVWREVLRVERVGVRDNFFELGGHSLLATQILSRTREAFQVKLNVSELFAAPTPESFAAVVEAAILEQADLSNLDEMLNLLEQAGEDEAEGLLALAAAEE